MSSVGGSGGVWPSGNAEEGLKSWPSSMRSVKLDQDKVSEVDAFSTGIVADPWISHGASSGPMEFSINVFQKEVALAQLEHVWPAAATKGPSRQYLDTGLLFFFSDMCGLCFPHDHHHHRHRHVITTCSFSEDREWTYQQMCSAACSFRDRLREEGLCPSRGPGSYESYVLFWRQQGPNALAELLFGKSGLRIVCFWFHYCWP